MNNELIKKIEIYINRSSTVGIPFLLRGLKNVIEEKRYVGDIKKYYESKLKDINEEHKKFLLDLKMEMNEKNKNIELHKRLNYMTNFIGIPDVFNETNIDESILALDIFLSDKIESYLEGKDTNYTTEDIYNLTDDNHKENKILSDVKAFSFIVDNNISKERALSLISLFLNKISWDENNKNWDLFSNSKYSFSISRSNLIRLQQVLKNT